MSAAPSVYLAYPIDLVHKDDQIEGLSHTLQQAKALLRGAGFVVYDPGRALMVGVTAKPGPVVGRINRAALNEVDALVAIYPELPTIGVPMEMQQAREREIPVLVISRAAGQSWALAGVEEFMVQSRITNRSVTQLLGRISAARYRHDLAHRLTRKEPVFITLEPGAVAPSQSHPGDAGFDLYCYGNWEIEPGKFLDVPTGVCAQFPTGAWAMITGRSSTIRRHNLLVSTGVIDSGYRGPLFAAVTNLSPDQTFMVKDGMRLAQLIPFPNLADKLEMVIARQLSPSERGESGFGSSGE